MSEALRSRLYDWFCEHIDEPTAEYAMSCLSPVPVSELATKDDIARLETATRKDFERLDTKFERLVDAREADRKEARHQFHWLVGIVVAIHGVSMSALGVILGSGVFS
ncbi:hypothetical protein [Candidatus Poriferisodalis sp.]|uniref:hypothetical protein n=1 Tax=Candidatus Poriferisodalis sp. TaxID=3101277 RepID=UPI003B02C046